MAASSWRPAVRCSTRARPECSAPKQGQKLFDEKHATFVQFARALRESGTQMLTAIDKKDPTGMMNAGAAMDGVCESCHLTFWYPNQVIPPLPADFGVTKGIPHPKRIPLSPG